MIYTGNLVNEKMQITILLLQSNIIMTERKTWTEEEDDLLKDLQRKNQSFQEQHRRTWSQIAEILNARTGANRTGKQCRQRWHNQLDPQIVRDKEWSTGEQDILFREQDLNGNKWALIAQKLPGRTDNNIKNYFYSTLRKALRKINSYLPLHKKQPRFKNVKTFKQQTLSKILAVADKKYQNKVQIKNNVVEQEARIIKNLLIQAERSKDIVISEEENAFIANIIDKILDFNRNCKRRKSKKRDSDEDPASQDVDQMPYFVGQKCVSQDESEENRMRMLKQLKEDSSSKKKSNKKKMISKEPHTENVIKKRSSIINIPEKISQLSQSVSILYKSDPKSQQNKSAQLPLIFQGQGSAFRRSSFKECPQPNNGNLFMGTSQQSQFYNQFMEPPLFPSISSPCPQQSDLFKNMRTIEKNDAKIDENGFIKEEFIGMSGFPSFNNMFQRSLNYANNQLLQSNNFKKIDGSSNIQEFLNKLNTQNKKMQFGK